MVLIDGEHRRVIRRIHVQPNHVGGLPLEIGIIRLHVALEPMRLQSSTLPGLGDQVVMDLQQTTELPRAPVRTAVGRRLARLLQHARLHRRCQHRGRLPAVPRAQAVEAILEEPAPPAIDVIAIARHGRFDRRVRGPIGQHQNHARAARVLRSDLETAHSPFQFGAFIVRQRQRHMAPQCTSTDSVSTSH
jgi:hypothetical protein